MGKTYGSCCCNCGLNTIITTEPVNTCICSDCTKKTGRKLKYYDKVGEIIEIKPVIWKKINKIV